MLRITALLAASVAALLLGLVSQASATELPDGRVYEMVTPDENYDANVYIPQGLSIANRSEVDTRLPFQVDTNGEAVAYVGDPTTGGTGDGGFGEGDEYLVRRVPNGGWSVPVNLQPTGIDSAFYEAFSPDLTHGIIESGASYGSPEVPPLNAQAPGGGYVVLYGHSLGGESYQPFFTTTPPNRVPTDFETAEIPSMDPLAQSQLAYAGASSDFSRLIFEANDALMATAADGGAGENNLYMSVDGRLSLVNVLPDGSTEASATFGAPPVGEPLRNPPDFSNVISTDGSRVFWTDLNPGKRNLYVSEGVGSSVERTVQVDASQVLGGRGGGGRFWTASQDGSRVFFTDSEAAKLTYTTQVGSGENLYVYEVPTGRLIDLTATAHAEVQGMLGEGETGAGEYTVYFTARGVLSENQNSDDVKAKPGEDNLYMLREGSQPTFIATLTSKDDQSAIPIDSTHLEEFGDWQPGLGHRTAEVSPDGRALTFMSNNQSFEGHREEFGGRSLEEVYVYEAEGDELFCASCSRDGVALQGSQSAGEGTAAYLPVSWSFTSLPRVMSDDGSRVFFDSGEPLVPEDTNGGQDTNGEQDVYEWERDGSGSCKASGGCVYLLSGGVGQTSSWLIGTSDNGDDVFLVTLAQLVHGDENEKFDLYDVRVDGVVPPAPATCTGTGCQGLPSAPPAFATPASETFSGVGDFPAPPPEPAATPKTKPPTRAQQLSKALAACHAKHGKPPRARCEAQARKRYGAARRARRAKGSRRGG